MLPKIKENNLVTLISEKDFNILNEAVVTLEDKVKSLETKIETLEYLTDKLSDELQELI